MGLRHWGVGLVNLVSRSIIRVPSNCTYHVGGSACVLTRPLQISLRSLDPELCTPKIELSGWLYCIFLYLQRSGTSTPGPPHKPKNLHTILLLSPILQVVFLPFPITVPILPTPWRPQKKHEMACVQYRCQWDWSSSCITVSQPLGMTLDTLVPFP